MVPIKLLVHIIKTRFLCVVHTPFFTLIWSYFKSKFVYIFILLYLNAFRFYICDEEGFQISPNIVRKNGEWEVEKEALGKNWSWRPYFLMNIIKLKEDTKGELSNIYSDIKTGELTRTFSMALDDNEYLFVDISYDYLYEHNLLY